MEREAIRPHILGRFDDLLLAVETHPGMLRYLDNAHSVGEGSVFATRGARRRRKPARRWRPSASSVSTRTWHARYWTAYAGRGRRLHAGGRHRVRARHHRLGDAAGADFSAVNRSTLHLCSEPPRMNQARVPCWARAMQKAVSNKAVPSLRISRSVRPRRSICR